MAAGLWGYVKADSLLGNVLNWRDNLTKMVKWTSTITQPQLFYWEYGDTGLKMKTNQNNFKFHPRLAKKSIKQNVGTFSPITFR